MKFEEEDLGVTTLKLQTASLKLEVGNYKIWKLYKNIKKFYEKVLVISWLYCIGSAFAMIAIFLSIIVLSSHDSFRKYFHEKRIAIDDTILDFLDIHRLA